MKVNNNKIWFKRLLLATIAIFVIIVAVTIINFLAGRGKDVIGVAVAPKNAKLVLDNTKTIRLGEQKFTTGTHTIKATRAGFKDQIKDFNTQDLIKTVWFNMIPKDDSGKKYVASHQKEFDRIIKIENEATVATVDSMVVRYPIIEKLPVNFSSQFIINYGPSKKYPENLTRLALYITAYSPTDKQSAITYIYGLGFDPSDYEIVFGDPPDVSGTGDNFYKLLRD
jgi:hypothetical protein